MNAPDLFGNEGREAGLRPLPAPVALDLFDAAAERGAMATGRAKSQTRAEILAGSGLRCICDAQLVRDRGSRTLLCPVCDVK